MLRFVKDMGRYFLEIPKPVIGIGPRGGKITGYMANGEPEYGGIMRVPVTSPTKEEAIAAIRQLAEDPKRMNLGKQRLYSQQEISRWAAALAREVEMSEEVPVHTLVQEYTPIAEGPDIYRTYRTIMASTPGEALHYAVRDYISEMVRTNEVPDETFDQNPVVVRVEDENGNVMAQQELRRSDIWRIPEDGLPDELRDVWIPWHSSWMDLSNGDRVFTNLAEDMPAAYLDSQSGKVMMGTIGWDSQDRTQLFLDSSGKVGILFQSDEWDEPHDLPVRGERHGMFVRLEDGRWITVNGNFIDDGRPVAGGAFFLCDDDGAVLDSEGEEVEVYETWPKESDDPMADRAKFVQGGVYILYGNGWAHSTVMDWEHAGEPKFDGNRWRVPVRFRESE